MEVGWGAVVLAGGGGARLGGADKAALEVAGRTLLEHALAAVAGAAETVVVGPPTATSRPVTVTREDPPGSGPAAGLLHGLGCFAGSYDVVVVLAVDMPLVSAGTVARLLAAVGPDVDGAVLDDGRPQPLCAAYRPAALLAAAPERATWPGLPVRRLVDGLRLAPVAAVRGEGRDVDTWDDLRDIAEDPLRDRGPGGQSFAP